MKKMNYITGVLNVILSALMAVVGTVLLAKLAGGTVAEFFANNSTKTAVLKIGAVIAVYAANIAILMLALKNIVSSVLEVDYSKGRKSRVFYNITNFIIVAVFVGIVGYFVFKKRAELNQMSIMEVTLIASVILASAVQLILLMFQFIAIYKNQKIKALKFREIKKELPTVVEKVEKTKKINDIKVDKNEVSTKRNTDSLVKPHIRFRNKK